MNPGLLTTIVTTNAIVAANNHNPSPGSDEILWALAISAIVVISICASVWWFVDRKL